VAAARLQFRDILQVESKYGRLEASDVTRPKELEHENPRLKRMYADLSLENAALKDVIAKTL
ncbi:MAG: hypothetical protein KBE28_16100, partial [Nitrospira sp.]|nr:hypothetical protein [Nitrospira sp.]